MKICFNETLDSSNLMDDLELCEKYGYDAIEIRLAYLKDYLKDHSWEELKAWFDTHNIKPYGYNSITDINFRDEEQWKEVTDMFLFACEASEKLGGHSIVVVPTMSEEMINKDEKEIFESSIEALKKLSDLAAPYDVMLGFEPIGEDVFCVRSTKQGWDIVQAVDRDNVGISVDAFNLYDRCGFADIEDLRSLDPAKICVFHINDAVDKPVSELNTMKDRLYPGDGVIQLGEMCGILREIGYDDVASLELFGDWMYEGTPEDVIRDGFEKTRAFLKKQGLQ